ncbi:hypothetical protein [Roseisolibacter agri]|uniref:hypothetical protein n=1 Tax=Roseisolibacter agri TaxID=2014610 RepID=UPI0024E0DFD4|nr:hypothetical protein [Roseisolibacter agri]
MPTRPLHLAALVVAAGLVAPVGAQAPARPASWRAAFDAVGVPDSALAFAAMPPGWHLTAPATGGMVWDPAHVVRGTPRIESELFLFAKAPGTGTGLLVGGQALGESGARWTAFVAGPDGRFRVLRRDGTTVRELVPWTAHPAIPVRPADKPNVKLVLGVESAGEAVRFLVNGAAVAELPRTTVQPDGVVGFRLEPGTNTHVSTLRLDGRNVAPEPAKSAH